MTWWCAHVLVLISHNLQEITIKSKFILKLKSIIHIILINFIYFLFIYLFFCVSICKTILYRNKTATHHLKTRSKTIFSNITHNMYFRQLATIAWHPHAPLSVTLRCTLPWSQYFKPYVPAIFRWLTVHCCNIGGTELKWRSHPLFLPCQLRYLTVQLHCCHFCKAPAILMFYGPCYPWGSM